jgi:O-acetyl-ADP-ribose deacetylase
MELYPNISAILDISADDITSVAADAIVNSAGSHLKGGGGVDGAIHRAAGPALARASAKLAPCPVGDVRVTSGFKLPARLVVHTVAPRPHTKGADPETLLAACYARSVAAADHFGARTLAIPAIGAGVRSFPLETVARIAMTACRDQLAKCRFVRLLEFCLPAPKAREAFANAMAKIDRIVKTDACSREGTYFGEFDLRFVYVNIIGMLRHEWAFLARTPQGQRRIIYTTDSGAVFGTLEVGSIEQARRLVRERGFERWAPDTRISSLMALPWWPPVVPS